MLGVEGSWSLSSLLAGFPGERPRSIPVARDITPLDPE